MCAVARRSSGICPSAARTRSTFASTKPGMVVEQRAACGTSGASGPTACCALKRSSRYWRQPEYELNAEVKNASARRDAVVAHLPQRVGEERVPVAVAEVDRQVDAVRAQLGLERRDQLAVLAR